MARLPLWKDLVLTGAGLAGVAHQEFWRVSSDSGLLLLYTAMLGYGTPEIIDLLTRRKGGDK